MKTIIIICIILTSNIALAEKLTIITDYDVKYPYIITFHYNKSITKASDKTSVKYTNNYTFLCYSSGYQKSVAVVSVDEIVSPVDLYQITLKEDVLKCQKAFVIVTGLSYEDKSVDPVMGEVKLIRKEDPYKFTMDKVGDKKDAVVYINGNVAGARHSKSFYNLDGRVAYNLNIANGLYAGLLVDAVTSTDPKIDNDTLTVGGNLLYVLLTAKEWQPGVLLRDVPKYESDIGFKNSNFVNSLTMEFPTHVFNNGVLNLGLKPLAGVDIGKNLKSPISRAKDKTIERILFGATAGVYLDVKDKLKFITNVDLDISFIRRILLEPEIYYNLVNGSYEPIDISRSSRDSFTATLSIGINDYFSLTNTFEISETPPTYKKVDQKFLVGFTYKFKQKE